MRCAPNGGPVVGTVARCSDTAPAIRARHRAGFGIIRAVPQNLIERALRCRSLPLGLVHACCRWSRRNPRLCAASTRRQPTVVPSFAATAAAVTVALASCATSPDGATAREAVVVESASGHAVTPEQMADALARSDVVVLGEEHDNDAGHALQLRTVELLHERRPRMAIALEMFERDVQEVLDRYLAGTIDEDEFLKAARPWRNYARHYRPIVEYARAHGLPVLAANLPLELARKASRQGAAALQGAPHAPAEVRTPRDEYWTKFQKAMEGHPMGTPKPAEKTEKTEKTEKSEKTGEKAEQKGGAQTAGGDGTDVVWRMYEAQCLRDEAMAETIVDWLSRQPSPPPSQPPGSPSRPLVVLLCGKTHADHELGTVARVRRRLPDLDVGIVTMLESKTLAPDTAAEARDAGDWVALVPPQPSPPPRSKQPAPQAPIAGGDTAAPHAPRKHPMPGEPAAVPPGHPAPKAPSSTAETPPPSEGGRPALGFMPDYEQSGDGVVVAALRAGGPAEQAGIREGDRIVRLGRADVEDAITYSAALADLTPGQEVDVVVQRGDREHTFRVRVGTRIH